MPVPRTTNDRALVCGLLLVLLVGCRGEAPICPEASVTANPQEIPDGVNATNLFVEVTNPFPQNGLTVVTELTAISGVIDDPFARAATYTCAHDVAGPVEICGNATYTDSAVEECSETRCIDVICPEEKNACPVVSSLTVEPMDAREEGAATIEVVAEDPDDRPETPLVTTLTARHGTITDPKATKATYTCDDDVGGVIEICVMASDGDSSCDDELCTWVRCPGEPLENTCPIIEDLTATPNPIPVGEDTTTVRVDAIDPDEFPEPLETEFSSDTGAFENPNASETIFRCGEPGPVEVRVTASDGDPTCDDEPRRITIQCPSDIRPNLCPMLFVINAIPGVIPEGETTTRIETRGQDTDGLPLPLVLTLNALWGSFENTSNIQEGHNVVAQNATYVCDRPGEVEVCVDATDGACVKTLCNNVVCPDDVPIPP